MKRAAGLLFVLALPAIAAANEFCLVPGRTGEFYRGTEEIWKSFTARRMDEVEAYHANLLARHEKGELSDAHLGRAFAAFQVTGAFAEPLLQEWAHLYPKSPSAHLALAHHYASVGYAARGTEYASKTSETQFLAMGAAFRKAFEALEVADKYLKKPTLSASLRIWMGAASGTVRPGPSEVYGRAIKAYPDSLQVRIRYIRASAPKWGGSIAQLQSIVDDAKKLRPDDRRYIEYLVLQEMGSSMEWSKDVAKAAEYYRRSVPLCPGLDQSLERLIELQRDAKDFAGLLASTTQFIERQPRSGWAYTMRGWARQSVHNYREAFADFEKATQLAYGQAFVNLAWYYEVGNVVPRDYRKAIDLYMIADSHRVEGARERADRVRKGAGIDMK